MANPYVYTFRRRVLMQGVMVGIFAATLGLAAAVKNARNAADPVKLGSPIGIGLFSLSMPDGWQIKRRWEKAFPPVPLVQGLDPHGGRVFSATQHYLDYDTTPEAYMEAFLGLDEAYGEVLPVAVGGAEGVTITVVKQRQGQGWTNTTSHQFAVTVVDKRIVLELELESPGPSTSAGDRKVFREVVGSVKRKPVEP